LRLRGQIDNLAELRRMYEDERLRVPAMVRNAARGCQEPVEPDGQDRRAGSTA